MPIEWKRPEDAPHKASPNSIATKDILICFRHIDDEDPEDYQITSGKYNFRRETFNFHCRKGRQFTEVIGWAEINYPSFNLNKS
jgi:hypothetical protein